MPPGPNRAHRLLGCLLPLVLAFSAGCAGTTGSSQGKQPAPGPGEGAFLERAEEAFRSAGFRVERSSAGVVRSRPRAVPSALEPWRSGAGRGPGLTAAATLGEVREVATLRLLPAGVAGDRSVEAEVWLERAHRPSRRLAIRSDGAVFSEAGLLGGLREEDPLTEPFPDAGPRSPIDGADREDAAGRASGADPPLFGRARAPGVDAAVGPDRSGFRWDRWKRLPSAEADLLDAWTAAGE